MTTFAELDAIDTTVKENDVAWVKARLALLDKEAEDPLTTPRRGRVVAKLKEVYSQEMTKLENGEMQFGDTNASCECMVRKIEGSLKKIPAGTNKYEKKKEQLESWKGTWKKVVKELTK